MISPPFNYCSATSLEPGLRESFVALGMLPDSIETES